MVVGAASGAGKTTVVSALCRALSRRGVDVAPFKAQNMSNHTAVTPDGGEIGRAQAMQALAAGVDTDRRMGPVLLKPSAMRSSHVVVLGEEVAVDDAVGYGQRTGTLRPVVLEALQGLRTDHDMVLLEGAGGAAEINLLDRDLVNLPLAAAAGVPAVLVVDIDRGGAFAAAYGTWALLPAHLRSCLRGIVINGFRGDVRLLTEGTRDLERRTGVPVLGVLPHLGDHLMLGVEDSLDLASPGRPIASAPVARPVRIAVLRLPRLANPSDLDPLLLEPAVELRWATRPGDLDDADLVVLPGSRATVTDLSWLRRRRLDQAVTGTVAHVLGLCAGYQMLGTAIHDRIESEAGTRSGLGLLPVETTFTAPKVVQRSTGAVITAHRHPPTSVWRSEPHPVNGYQIRWGRTVVPDPVTQGAGPTGGPWLDLQDGPEGWVEAQGRVRGTSLHGVLDGDAIRQSLLAEVARARGRDWEPASLPYAQALQRHLDHLGDWVEEHLPVADLLELATTAARVGQEPGW